MYDLKWGVKGTVLVRRTFTPHFKCEPKRANYPP